MKPATRPPPDPALITIAKALARAAVQRDLARAGRMQPHGQDDRATGS